MNREDCVVLLSDFFLKLEELVNSPLKYLDFTVTLQNREGKDKRINILSFQFEEDCRSRVFIFPYEHEGTAMINSRAVLYNSEKFFRVKRDEEIESSIASLFPETFDVQNVDMIFEIQSIEMNEFSKYVLALDKIKKKFK